MAALYAPFSRPEKIYQKRGDEQGDHGHRHSGGPHEAGWHHDSCPATREAGFLPALKDGASSGQPVKDRCLAAHQDDPRPREGPHDAVLIRANVTVPACVVHGATTLVSIIDAKVYPGSVEGAAIEVFERAQATAPFDWR